MMYTRGTMDLGEFSSGQHPSLNSEMRRRQSESRPANARLPEQLKRLSGRRWHFAKWSAFA